MSMLFCVSSGDLLLLAPFILLELTNASNTFAISHFMYVTSASSQYSLGFFSCNEFSKNSLVLCYVYKFELRNFNVELLWGSVPYGVEELLVDSVIMSVTNELVDFSETLQCSRLF